MVPLETMPIWVRIYDLPLVMMNKERGVIYGSKLGKVREVDVQEDGCNKHDFFRIRVDLPVNRPLKRMLAIKIKVKGAEEIRRFNLRYERIPHFCFFCGFIGHSDKECEKRLANEEDPLMFSAELRCSPLKPFERKVSKVKAFQSYGVQRKLSFRGAGSASSSSAGQMQRVNIHEDTLPRVDAFDGFDSKEGKGEESVDAQLADKANLLSVSEQNSSKKRSEHKIGPVEESASLPSMEMIPAIRNLNSHQESLEESSSADCISPTKRKALTAPVAKGLGTVKQAVLEYDQTNTGAVSGVTPRALKRLKKGADMNANGKDMEATSPGAAGKLAGPKNGSRQEQ